MKLKILEMNFRQRQLNQTPSGLNL